MYLIKYEKELGIVGITASEQRLFQEVSIS